MKLSKKMQMSAGFASIAAAIAVMVFVPEGGAATALFFLALFFAGDFTVWNAERAAKASRKALAYARG